VANALLRRGSLVRIQPRSPEAPKPQGIAVLKYTRHNTQSSPNRPIGRPIVNVPNRYFVGETLAIIVCPAYNGKMFAVTIDKEDLERVKSRCWHVVNVKGDKGFLLYCATAKRKGLPFFYLHRFVMRAQRGILVDHIHHRTLDNRKSELRKTDISGNALNRRSGMESANRTGIRCVHPAKNGRFRAIVRGKHLGVFDTPDQASAVVRDFLTANDALNL